MDIPDASTPVRELSGDNSRVRIISPGGGIMEIFCDPGEPGERSFTEIIDGFTADARRLKAAGGELMLVRGISSLAAARAAVFAAKKADIPIIPVLLADEDGMTEHGSALPASLICLQELGIAAFALETEREELLPPLLAELHPCAKVPLAAVCDCLDGKTAGEIYRSGADIFIGKGDDSLAESLTPALRDTAPAADEDDIILSNETQVFFLSPDYIESSEPIECSIDMSDELLELADTSLDVITVEINTPDDAYRFSQNAHMSALPVMFRSDSPIALKTALLCYHGRAMIDSSSRIGEEDLQMMAYKYGAVLY